MLRTLTIASVSTYHKVREVTTNVPASALATSNDTLNGPIV